MDRHNRSLMHTGRWISFKHTHYHVSLNKVELVGGVANDPFFKITKNGRPFALVNVITNSRLRLESGEFVDRVCHTIVGMSMHHLTDRTPSSVCIRKTG